jgi:TRAP-type C4-dicarboxylate transport system permease small subunit
MNILTDNNAQAYAWVVILAVIFFAAILWAGLNVGVEQLTNEVNNQVDAGTISSQTVSNFDKMTVLFSGLLIFVCIDVVLWAIVRGQQGGDD